MPFFMENLAEWLAADTGGLIFDVQPIFMGRSYEID